MTARAWTANDPEPPDRPAVVDCDGITWLWMDPFGEDYEVWTRQRVTHHRRDDGELGAVTGFSTAYNWGELVSDYGPLREATSDEGTSLTVTYESACRVEEPS